MDARKSIKSPLVSVIIPTFNRAGLIRSAVKSVLAQTMADFELIVVDDGSTVSIEAALVDFADQRIKLIRREVNCGAATARNVGIREARGQYIAFLDSDDRWLPDKLERQVTFMNGTLPQSADISCTGFYYSKLGFFKPRKKKRICVVPPKALGMPRAFLEGCFISPGSTMMVRRTFLEKVGMQNESLKRFEDWEWMMRATRYAAVAILPIPLSYVKHRQMPELELVRRAGHALMHAQAGNVLKQHGIFGLARFYSSINIEIAILALRKRKFGYFLGHGIWAFFLNPARVFQLVASLPVHNF